MDLEGTPGFHGYRMPAEWETHSKCWMGWPVSTSPLSRDMIMLFRFMGHEINDFFFFFFAVWEMDSHPDSCCA
jgi:hypothetical protein